MVIPCPQHGASVRQALGKGPQREGAVWGDPDCVLRLLGRGLVGYQEDWQRGKEDSSPPVCRHYHLGLGMGRGY